jgi:MOSC domain-containing protein YiiM
MQTIEELMSRFPRAGKVEWIGIAGERRGAVRALTQVEVVPGSGVAGEHHCKRSRRAKLLPFEHEATPAEAGIPQDGRDSDDAVAHATETPPGPKRQVTLIQHEHLAVIAALLGHAVPPELLRRNVVVSGVNLIGLKNRRFRIGTALLEGSGPCDPCSRMEENLGPGGYNAMRGHGGITARVVIAGTIRPGDDVVPL